MNNSKIRVSNPHIPKNFAQNILEAVNDGFISSSSPYVSQFEVDMADLCKRQYALSCSSGTQALSIAIRALDLKPGTEVIIPNFCIISLLSAVLSNNLIPRFADPSDGYNVSLKDLLPLISSNTSAIIVAHMYGLAVDIQPIHEFCQQRQIFLIEDAAEAHGQSANSNMCGSFGDISTLSFFSNKHVTCGEGGMCLTDNADLAGKIANIKNLYFDKERSYKHQEVGEVGRMTTMQAVLGSCSLAELNQTVQRKKNVAQRYSDLLSTKVKLPPTRNTVSQNHYWVYPITFAEEKDYVNVARQLSSQNIEYRRIFYPLSMQPLLEVFGIPVIKNNRLKDLYERSMYIPIGPKITDAEIDRVAKNINLCL